jgi:uncharacterized repeat protein (TIGR03843 family)
VAAGTPDPDPRDARAADEAVALRLGEIEIGGRIMPASNATFFGTSRFEGTSVDVVYKPVGGERPLWDFPDGTLASREVAAYAVSEALGWDVVPPTVLRDGPLGTGMVQAWREPDARQEPVDLVRRNRVPDGFLHVLDAYDQDDRPISLVHEDSDALRRMAVFDVVVNNADRKGGHVLPMADGHRHGVDHGVSFHTDPKLRTVLWGWAAEPLDEEDAAGVRRLRDLLCRPDAELTTTLSELLDVEEVVATLERCEALLRSGRMPVPSSGRPSIPWPAF